MAARVILGRGAVERWSGAPRGGAVIGKQTLPGNIFKSYFV